MKFAKDSRDVCKKFSLSNDFFTTYSDITGDTIVHKKKRGSRNNPEPRVFAFLGGSKMHQGTM